MRRQQEHAIGDHGDDADPERGFRIPSVAFGFRRTAVKAPPMISPVPIGRSGMIPGLGTADVFVVQCPGLGVHRAGDVGLCAQLGQADYRPCQARDDQAWCAKRGVEVVSLFPGARRGRVSLACVRVEG